MECQWDKYANGVTILHTHYSALNETIKLKELTVNEILWHLKKLKICFVRRRIITFIMHHFSMMILNIFLRNLKNIMLFNFQTDWAYFIAKLAKYRSKCLYDIKYHNMLIRYTLRNNPLILNRKVQSSVYH